MNKMYMYVLCTGLGVLSVFGQSSPDSSGVLPLGPDAFNAVSAFFKYDTTIPLNGQTIERFETRTYMRDKIVFTGVRGDRVPAFLAIPKKGQPPYPLVLLFHISAGSKDSWWSATSFERGLMVTDSLLNLNIAVLALDAQYHGERSANIDYLPIEQMFFDQKWYYRFKDGIIQTIGDYQRAVDYVSENQNIDIQRIGVLGHSMGGVMSLLYAALDPRVKAVVAPVATLTDPWLYPIAPINIAHSIRVPTLVLAGRRDNQISVDITDLFFASLGTDVKEIELYDSGHRLPEENVSRSVQWLYKHLSKEELH